MKDKVSFKWKKKKRALDNIQSNNEILTWNNPSYTHVKPKYLDYLKKPVKKSRDRVNNKVFSPFSKTYNRTKFFSSPYNLYRKNIE